MAWLMGISPDPDGLNGNVRCQWNLDGKVGETI